jgi:ABC-type cobalamin/Fe3+-siderophores transport system ATPase subunit
MKERPVMAWALLHRPPVLLLNQPARGLDSIAARRVRGAIERWRDEGTTILLSTHDLAAAVCKAPRGLRSAGSDLIDLSGIASCIAAFLVASAWGPRRQAGMAGAPWALSAAGAAPCRPCDLPGDL